MLTETLRADSLRREWATIGAAETTGAHRCSLLVNRVCEGVCYEKLDCPALRSAAKAVRALAGRLPHASMRRDAGQTRVPTRVMTKKPGARRRRNGRVPECPPLRLPSEMFALNGMPMRAMGFCAGVGLRSAEGITGGRAGSPTLGS